MNHIAKWCAFLIGVLLLTGCGVLPSRTSEYATINSQRAIPDAIATWNSYTYSAVQSGILPDISFQYPPVFGDAPIYISSRTTHTPEFISDDWGGFIDFKELRIEFFKQKNPEINFETFVVTQAHTNTWDAPKYFNVQDYKAARIRFTSASRYDADAAWYFIELPDTTVLSVSTVGDTRFLYDDDIDGFSTRDRIIKTFKFENQELGFVADSMWGIPALPHAPEGTTWRKVTPASLQVETNIGQPVTMMGTTYAIEVRGGPSMQQWQNDEEKFMTRLLTELGWQTQLKDARGRSFMAPVGDGTLVGSDGGLKILHGALRAVMVTGRSSEFCYATYDGYAEGHHPSCFSKTEIFISNPVPLKDIPGEAFKG